MTDLICFEVNDWEKYPKYFDEWFNYKLHRHSGGKWMPDLDKFAKENELCVQVVSIDMAISLMFTGTKKWAEEHIPELFEEEWNKECVFGVGHIIPHEIKGSPSYEFFLDWTEDNYGAKELIEDD